MNKIQEHLLHVAQQSVGDETVLTSKDFVSDQEIRWCPGCGDYSILKQVQTVMPQLGIKRENMVFVSGIGCSSRFPYYMETFGMHTIHGRAAAIASGLKMSRPDLDIWMISGDGDSLSIGGNHFIHLLRRNLNINLLLFNNQIYGLTKGQYSPTSEQGKITKSTPMGSPDFPFNPAALAMGADGTFIARTLDRDPKHMQEVLLRAHKHKGTSFVEIYQNCNVFNDGAFFTFTEKETKGNTALFVENGKPLVFSNGEKGIRLEGHQPKIVDLTTGEFSASDCWIHDDKDFFKASLLARFFDDVTHTTDGTLLPRPFGVIYETDRACYEDTLQQQVDSQMEAKGFGDLDKILKGNDHWEVK